MTTFRRQILMKALMLFDLGILAFSYVVAAIRIWHLTEFSSFAAFFSMRTKVVNMLLSLGLFCSWHVIFSVFGLYRSRRLGDQKREAADILKATALAALALGVAAALFRVRMITPVFISLFWAMSSAILVVCRLSMREFLAFVRT